MGRTPQSTRKIERDEMITWDDFHRQLDKVFYEIEMTVIALEKMTVSFENVSKTYDGMI